ncbi:succinate dehydrogenase assembly factor 3, mitochondrial [Condylostylus longicornis]|uniref:succinate dehydrogenase assembly factor 3, mitochondrial n=1 Tax=Condylostylus longicornis TaxID=2530218 RepID=UPI00244DCD8F|nr:succinate dehydrogenase assembly factor 3, mitochondrial [Condylostylus longicornis]
MTIWNISTRIRMSKIITLNNSQKVRLLYKTILKLHRGLPFELRGIGNSYVKREFKLHKDCSVTEAHFFIAEWSNYAILLSEQLGVRGKPKGKLGFQMELNDLDKFREDQILQLYELLKAIKA